METQRATARRRSTTIIYMICYETVSHPSQASLQHAIAWDNLKLQFTRYSALELGLQTCASTLILWGVRDWTQILMHARQRLYQLNYTPRPHFLKKLWVLFLILWGKKTHSWVLQRPTFTSRAFFAFYCRLIFSPVSRSPQRGLLALNI